MINSFFNKRFFNILLLICLAGFLIFPKFCLANDFEEITPEEIKNYLELPEKDVKNLLLTLKQVFTTDWIYRESSGYSTPEECLVPLVLRKAVRIDALNHLLIDAPIEITWNIINNAAKIVRLFLIQDPSVILDELEKESVQKAIEYGMNFLLQNEIRVTPGVIEFEYLLQKGGTGKAILQYVLIYQPLDAKHGKVAIRFYAPQSIEPPKSEGAWGMTGTPHSVQGNLPPFIVEITGKVEKDEFNNYFWIDEKGRRFTEGPDSMPIQPSVKIILSEPVPDLGIRPLTFSEKYFLKPIRTTIKEIEIVITKVIEKGPNIVENLLKLPWIASDIWKQIKSTISQYNPFAAGVGQVIAPPVAKNTGVRDTEVGSPETFKTEPNIKVEPIQISEKEKEELKKKELQERVDDLLEQIDLIQTKIAKLTKEKEIQKVSKEEKVEETSEELKEKKETKEGEERGEEVGQELRPTFCQKLIGDQPSRNRVIFNEIAWMGTDSAKRGLDEWIELKNISGQEIDLTGWQILNKDNKIKIIFGQKLFLANGLLLLERTDDGSVPGIKADLIYTGPLKNENEALYLFDQNCQLQDFVEASPNWPAGDNSTKRTMERKSDLNWQMSANPGGTPKAENSGGYYPYVGGGWVSPPVISYPKILITEIQIWDATSTDHDFIELYNPNSNDVDISDWQLKKKNSAGNEKSIPVFPSGSIISGHGYFLWANSNYANSTGLQANATSTQTLAQNNSLALLDPNRTIVDMVAWGTSTNPFVEGSAFPQNPEKGKSLGRKWSTTTQTYIDTDNNQDDFEIQNPTPKAQNQSPEPEQEPIPESKPEISFAKNVVISEVLATGEEEFVELYNPLNEPVDISSWYLSYFSEKRNWNDPYRNWQFTASTIPAKSYFLIGIFNFPNPDLEVKKTTGESYSTSTLSNDNGAIGIFSCNPKIATTSTTTLEAAIKQAKNCKIDVVGWKKSQTSDESIVKEVSSTIAAPAGKSLARKIATTSEGYLAYIDTDNNQNDFEIQEPTPKRRNLHSFPDLDDDGIIDSFDPETIVSTNKILETGEYHFQDLILKEGVRIECPGVKIFAKNLNLATSSMISADGKGYASNWGSGSGKEGSGGGYGGRGGNHGNFSGGETYGSLFRPIDLGSDGGSHGGRLGGAGGGAVWLKIENSLVINGLISANGEKGLSNTGLGGLPATGGGSGGSIYIETNDFSGSGQITANGGDIDSAGAGGGGRIAIYYSQNQFQGQIQAFGGKSEINYHGGAGTIYLKDEKEEKGELIIDNNGILGATELLEANYSFASLKILNSAHFLFDQAEITLENLEIKNNSILEFLSTTTTSTINVLNQLTVNSTSSLISPALVFLKINSQEISLSQNSSLFGNFDILVNEFFIDETSKISADGKGYPAEQGLGKGVNEAGGSYGGVGRGNATSSIYGQETEPKFFGSGGGNAGSYLGGAGAGAILLEIKNTLSLDGIISANGENGRWRIGTAPATGAGSGVSIYIKINLFQGSGKISANGGNADSAGAGGGGRIAIDYSINEFLGEITADGGTDIYSSTDIDGNKAGKGSIYFNPPVS